MKRGKGRSRWAGLVVLACALLVTTPRLFQCTNDCDFHERCKGNKRQVCGGVDQCVGRRIQSEPCAGDTPICVELTPYSAKCMSEQPPACDTATFEAHCEGDALVECVGGHLLRTECGAREMTCADIDDSVHCRWPER